MIPKFVLTELVKKLFFEEKLAFDWKLQSDLAGKYRLKNFKSGNL